MITIENKSYIHSGFSWCEQCKENVVDGTDSGQQYKICIKGHKYFYGRVNNSQLIQNQNINRTILFMV